MNSLRCVLIHKNKIGQMLLTDINQNRAVFTEPRDVFIEVSMFFGFI